MLRVALPVENFRDMCDLLTRSDLYNTADPASMLDCRYLTDWTPLSSLTEYETLPICISFLPHDAMRNVGGLYPDG